MIQRIVRIVVWLSLGLIVLNLSSCTGNTALAPVKSISPIEPLPKSGLYRVKHDDTLYSIAWRYGLDYRDVAKLNHITRLNHIEPGRVIYLDAAAIHQKPVTLKPASATHKNIRPSVIKTEIKTVNNARSEAEPTADVTQWRWPARGRVIEGFSVQNKGINIGGKQGAPIFATAPGKVVYCGDGLRAYGKLIIIKHNSVFLSAYAHNKIVLIKEGDWVKRGQKIAEMGNSGARHVMLHFEIRQSGNPVNPLRYLTQR